MISNYNFNKNKTLLIGLLLVLNIIIRIPSIPHEKGYDSFFIHSLANSITNFGAAEWWINWLSVFGLYPYSYASAVPFSLSGMSQLTGIEMEKTILLYCLIIGIFSAFTAYNLAGKIYDDFIFKYIMALFFSIAPGVMVFTTWEISTRGQFIAFFPLFLYILLSKFNYVKKIILLSTFFVLVFATHHYAYFLIPATLLFIFLALLRKFGLPYYKRVYLKYIFLTSLFLVAVIPFFTRSLIGPNSRYSWIIDALITNMRYTGPIIIFLIGGIFYLVLKNKKLKNEELYMLSASILFTPTLYSHTYGPFIIVLFIIFVVSVGFRNVLYLISLKKSRLLILIIILNILVFVSFSGAYNHVRTGGSKSFWYMSDETYVAGIWAKEHVPENLRGLDTGFETGRFFAISEGHPITPTIGAGNLAYGFINKSEIQYTKNSPLSKAYYFDGPYSVKSKTTYSGLIEWLRQTGKRLSDLDSFDYFIEDKYNYKPILNVVRSDANKIYDNTRIAVWKLKLDES